MNQLRKIPLGPFIEILQDLFETGADFIDISGENNEDGGETPKDMIKITVRPEYLNNDEGDDTPLELQQEINMDYSDFDDDDEPTELSDDDINALIE